MTYALIAHTVSTGGAGGSTTPAIDTTGTDQIVIGVVYSVNHAPTLTDNKSNTWTAIGTFQGAAQESVQLYYCQAPTVGAGHTFSALASSSFASAFVQAFSGSASSPLDKQTGNNSGVANTSIQTGSITPSNNNELICVMYGNEGTAGSQAMDSGMTLTDTLPLNASSWGSSMGYKIQTTAAAINVTGSSSANGTNSIVIASFKAAGSSGTVFNQSLSATTTPNAAIVRKTAKAIAASTTPAATIMAQHSGSIVNHQTVSATSTPVATISTKLIPKPGSSTRAFFNASS